LYSLKRTPLAPGASPSTGPRRSLHRLQRRAAALPPTVRGLLWAAASGLVFAHLNALMRLMALELDPFQTQFLRYLFGLVVMLPLVLRGGVRAYWPKQLGGQFTRGAVQRSAWACGSPRCRGSRSPT